MTTVTIDDRKKELRALLYSIRTRPSHDWSAERRRIVVLQQMVAGQERRNAAP
jgi:hypothetical protein